MIVFGTKTSEGFYLHPSCYVGPRAGPTKKNSGCIVYKGFNTSRLAVRLQGLRLRAAFTFWVKCFPEPQKHVKLCSGFRVVQGLHSNYETLNPKS